MTFKMFYQRLQDVLPPLSTGCTSTIKHDTEACSMEFIKPKLYPIPVHLTPYFKEEVDQLISQDIIRPSSSPHCSPIVMVKKSTGGYRMTIDYRVLNSFTVFHAELINTITTGVY